MSEHIAHTVLVVENKKERELLLVLPFEQKENVFLPKRRMLLF